MGHELPDYLEGAMPIAKAGRRGANAGIFGDIAWPPAPFEIFDPSLLHAFVREFAAFASAEEPEGELPDGDTEVLFQGAVENKGSLDGSSWR